jgi:hypothetical protein
MSLSRTVLADKKTSDSRRCHFRDVQRDHRYEHRCSESSDESCSDEHANMNRARLQGASDDVDDGSKDYRVRRSHVSKMSHRIT